MSQHRYHVNPKTGRPNICSAQTPDKCQFAKPDEAPPPHYASKEDARAGYAASMEKETVAASISKGAQRKNQSNESATNGTSMTADDDQHEMQYSIHEQFYDKAVKSIERANAKLKKLGVSGRYEYSVEEKFVDAGNNDDPDDILTAKTRRFNFTVTPPAIIQETDDGEVYEFQAAFGQEEAGIVSRVAPGGALQGYTTKTLKCDHCGQNRNRKETYLVRSKNGKTLQIGSACLEDYMGVKPKGLWALTYDPLEEAYEETEKYEANGGGAGHYGVKGILAIALAASNNGENFISNATARIHGTDNATSSKVVNILHASGANLSEQEKRELAELRAKAENMLQDGSVDTFLEQAKAVDGNDEYIRNLKVTLNGENVSAKSVNLLVSAIGAVNRKERLKKAAEQREQRTTQYASGHYGNVGDKISKGSEFELVDNALIGGTDFQGNPITRSKVTMKDADGHQVVWFASRIMHFAEGEKIVKVSSGTVAKHGDYNGSDQTIVKGLRILNESPRE